MSGPARIARLRPRRHPDGRPRRARTGASRTTSRAAATGRCARSSTEKVPPHDGDRRSQEVGAARARRRRLSDRPQVELHAAAVCRREVSRLQFRRRRARHVQGPRHPALQPARADRGHGDRARTRWAARAATTTSTARSGRSTSAARRRWRRPTPRASSATNILGSDWTFQLHNHHGFGAYICGEETALLESLEGKKGQPRFKPPFPASYGLYGKPTTINNTETFAAVPWIISNGGEAFLELGKAEQRRHQDLLGRPATSSGPATSKCSSARRSRSCSRWRAACAAGASSRR